jgi:hypothetical protein
LSQARRRAPAQSLPERFFARARDVLLQEAETLDFQAADILEIAQDRAMREDFRKRFQQETNNLELGKLILDYLDGVAEDMEDAAEISEIKLDLVDRAGMPVAASVTGAAIVAIIVSGGTLGPALLLCFGLVGLAVSGTSRTLMKLSSRKSKSAARRVRRLMADLGTKNEQP